MSPGSHASDFEKEDVRAAMAGGEVGREGPERWTVGAGNRELTCPIAIHLQGPQGVP